MTRHGTSFNKHVNAVYMYTTKHIDHKYLEFKKKKSFKHSRPYMCMREVYKMHIACEMYVLPIYSVS